jgi:hypothetical protein
MLMILHGEKIEIEDEYEFEYDWLRLRRAAFFAANGVLDFIKFLHPNRENPPAYAESRHWNNHDHIGRGSN